MGAVVAGRLVVVDDVTVDAVGISGGIAPVDTKGGELRCWGVRPLCVRLWLLLTDEVGIGAGVGCLGGRSGGVTPADGCGDLLEIRFSAPVSEVCLGPI